MPVLLCAQLCPISTTFLHRVDIFAPQTSLSHRYGEEPFEG